ncbi:unknown [Clostridium sp. CAG:288]|nr:unknown [Clostridium sp. CAG:288]
MRTREEIEKDMAALFVGGCQDRIMTFTELKHRIIMLGKYRKELDELDALEKTNNKIKDQK